MIIGQRIRSYEMVDVAAGQHVVRWNSLNEEGIAVPSGIYLYQIESSAGTDVRRMILLR